MARLRTIAPCPAYATCSCSRGCRSTATTVKPRPSARSATASTSTSRSAWTCRAPAAATTSPTRSTTRALFTLVRGVVEDQQYNLIEAVAARVAERLLSRAGGGEREGPRRQAATDPRRHRPLLGDHRAPGGSLPMSAVIVDGKAVAAELRAELAADDRADVRGRRPAAVARGGPLRRRPGLGAVRAQQGARGGARRRAASRCTRRLRTAPPRSSSRWSGRSTATTAWTGSWSSCRCRRRSTRWR